MFTTTNDYAVARYTLPDGTEIAFAHDDMATNPVTDCEYSIGIIRDDRNAIATDPTGVLEEYDSLIPRIEDLEAWIEWFRTVNDGEEPEEALEELEDCRDELKAITFLEWTDKEEYGWPSYRIAYRAADLIADGWNGDKLDEIVKGMAREYSAWANGSVYLMGVEVPGEETEYLCCHAGFDPYNKDEVKDMAEGIVASADGLARA